MIAWYLDTPGQLVRRDVPLPEPDTDQVLLRVTAITWGEGDAAAARDAALPLPRLPGQAGAGVIEAVGSRVPAQLHPGQAVTWLPWVPCNRCAACRARRTPLCPHGETLGRDRDGMLAEHRVLPWWVLAPAETLPPETLALAPPLALGVRAAERARLAPDDFAAVWGDGPLALAAIATLAPRATVVALVHDESWSPLALAAGAAQVIPAAIGDVGSRLRAAGHGHDPIAAILADDAATTLRPALANLRAGGRLVWTGDALPTIGAAGRRLAQRELELLGVAQAAPEHLHAALRLLEQRRVPTTWIAATLPFAQAPRLLAAQAPARWQQLTCGQIEEEEGLG
jgi:threonine dehydrogenase-like Zn-dependent dehydrogenase